jgi:hypothetical protein
MQVKHAGSCWRLQLKNDIYQSLHLWGLIPTPEQQATMTSAQILEFKRNAVANLVKHKGYVHVGNDSEGVRL